MEESETIGSKRKNWAGNYTFKAENIYEPGTVAEIQAFVKQLCQQKAMGSNHCFNDIANSPNNHPDFLGLTKKYDPERKFNNHKFSKKYLLILSIIITNYFLIAFVVQLVYLIIDF